MAKTLLDLYRPRWACVVKLSDGWLDDQKRVIRFRFERKRLECGAPFISLVLFWVAIFACWYPDPTAADSQ